MVLGEYILQRCKTAVVIGAVIVLFWLPEQATGAPQIGASTREFQFGDCATDTVIEASFEIRNDGNEPLVILNLRPDCSCVFTRIGSKRIPPGAKTVLVVGLSLKSKNGMVQREVDVQSNDPLTPDLILKLAGKAVVPIAVTPSVLAFGMIGSNDAPYRTVDLEVADPKESLHILKIESGDSQIVTARAEEVERGKTIRLHVRLAKQLTPGWLHSYIAVYTDHPHMKVVGIAVTADVIGDVTVEPSEICLLPTGRIHDGDTMARRVTINPLGIGEFKILGVEVPDSSIATKVRAVGKNGYEVEVSGLVARPELNGKAIVIRTDIASLSCIRIPLRMRKETASRPPTTTTSPNSVGVQGGSM